MARPEKKKYAVVTGDEAVGLIELCDSLIRQRVESVGPDKVVGVLEVIKARLGGKSEDRIYSMGEVDSILEADITPLIVKLAPESAEGLMVKIRLRFGIKSQERVRLPTLTPEVLSGITPDQMEEILGVPDRDHGHSSLYDKAMTIDWSAVLKGAIPDPDASQDIDSDKVTEDDSLTPELEDDRSLDPASSMCIEGEEMGFYSDPDSPEET